MISVELKVRNLERSVRFYRELAGVPLERAEPHEPLFVEHYETMIGGVYFGLYPAGDEGSTARAEVGFSVDDLDAAHRVAERAGIGVVAPPSDRPWGRSAAYVDPDGNVVSLTETPD